MNRTQDSIGKECPKCSYLRTEADIAPEWQCPSCGIAYAKFEASVDSGQKAKEQVIIGSADIHEDSKSDMHDDNDVHIRSRTYKTSTLVGVILVSLVLGYYAGREHVKYELRSVIADAFSGFGSALSGDNNQVLNMRSSEPEKPPVPMPIVVTATLFEKGFQESDFERKQYSDLLTFGVRFENLEEKEIRAFDGVLTVYDLLENKIISINMAINDSLASKGHMSWRGHIDYNQFLNDHIRFRGAEIQNLKTSFVLRKVLYEDGTFKEF